MNQNKAKSFFGASLRPASGNSRVPGGATEARARSISIMSEQERARKSKLLNVARSVVGKKGY